MTNSLTLETEVIELPYKVPQKPPSNTKFVLSLITPSIILLVFAILIPIILGIFISFTNSSGSEGTGYFGNRIVLDNFYDLLFYGKRNSNIFWQYTYQTLFFSVVSLSIEFVLGLIFAFILNKNFKGRGLARATLLIPWAIPTVASATIFRTEIFSPANNFGLVNSLLSLFNFQTIEFYGVDAEILFNLPVFVPYEPFVTEIPIKMTMITAIAIDVWKTTPFITLLILAALQIVPEDLYKAGDIAGATGWQKFRYVSWPLIKPGVGIALIFRMMQALRVYDAIVVFNDNSVNSMTSQAVNFWLNTDWGLASTVAFLLFVIIIIFALILLFWTRRRGIGNQKEVEEKNIEKVVEEKYIEKEEIYGVDQFLRATAIDFETKIEPPSQRKINWFKRKRNLKRIGFYFLVIFMCLFCAFPFMWIVLRSFRYPYLDLRQDSFEIIPRVFSIEAYKLLFENSRFTGVSFERALINSFIVSGLTVLVVISLGSLIAYALAKFKFKGKRILNSYTFSMNSLPPLIIIIPFFIQTISISQLITGNTNFLSYFILLLGIIFIALDVALYLKSRKYKKKLFIATLCVIVIISVSVFLYIRFSFLIFAYKTISSMVILLSGILFFVVDIVVFIVFIILNKNYSWKLFIASLGIILIVFWSLFDFILTTSNPFALQDNKFGLVLPYAALNLPLAVFILVAFFRDIPNELWNAAKVDGASNFQIFRKVILPLTIPGIFTCAILVFIAVWNELLFARIFLTSDANHTVPRAILRFIENELSLQATWDTGITLLAATSLATVPLVIVVLIFQKKIVSGLTRGAVKG